MIEYNRYRNQSAVNVPGKHTWAYNGPPLTESIALPALTSTQTYDTLTPGFHKRRNAGEIFNNEFFHVETKFECNDVRFGLYQGLDSSDQHNVLASYSDTFDRSALFKYCWPQTLPVPSIDVENDARKAQIDALAAVNSTDLDALTFAGEWHKTKSLHRDVGNALLKLAFGGAKGYSKKSGVKKIPLFDEYGRPVLNRSGKPQYRYMHMPGRSGAKGETFTKRFSDVYLIGRYGIAPLLNDLDNAWKYLMRKHYPRFTARGNVTSQATSSSILTTAEYRGYWNIQFQCVRTLSTRYGILYTADEVARRLAMLGLSRPLSTIWELAPWSFVGDWFLQVGNYLDAMQPALASKTLSAWGGTLDTRVYTWVPANRVQTTSTPPTERWSGYWNGSMLYQETVKHRFPWNAALPSRPAFGSGFNAIRSGDFAALVLQRIKAKF